MRAARWAGITLGGLALLVAALIFIADTSIGHRLILDRIAALSLKNGMKIRIGRIDGSIYGEATLRDIRLYDPKGLFFSASEARLDWTPAAWFANRLSIDELIVPVATLHKLPKFIPSETRGPILPEFDIRIGRLQIDRLIIAQGLAGPRRVGSVSGSADIRNGRAMVKLNADAAAGDRLVVDLDAEPDGNDFDLSLALNAPAGGVFGQLIGTQRPVALRVEGDGDWNRWQGNFLGTVSGARLAQLGLTNNKGVFALNGQLALQSITKGRLQRMTAPVVRVRGDASLENRRLQTALRLTSAAIAVDIDGIVDLAKSEFDPITIGARLLQPQALFPNMRGRDIVLKARLDGPFSRASFDYLISSPFFAFDQTGFEMARASGQGRLGPSPVNVPVRFTARRVIGVGDVAGGILGNLSVDGVLRVTSKLLTGDDLRLRSDKLNGKLTLIVDLVTGRYDVGLAGQLNRYLIPGLGIVDVKSELRVVPGPGGRGTQIAGRGQAWVRRLDNSFLAGLTKGLPTIETGLRRDADGILRFVNLRLRSPGIQLSGNGYRRRDGTFHFEGSGRQAQYGPITRFVLDGNIARPKIDMVLARPNDAMGLRNVRVQLDPNAQGFVWRAAGGSAIGPFNGNGAILLQSGQAATIQIAHIDASDIVASGSLRSLPGGFAGQIALTGQASGTLDFAPQNGIQRIAANIRARDARLEGPPLTLVRRGRFNGVILLDPKGTSIEGSLTAQGVSRGGFSVARLAGNIRLRGGVGELRGSIAGSRGRSFDLQGVAQIAPNRIQLVAQGSVDRRPLKLTSPAVLIAEGGGWRLQPTTLEFGGGRAQVAGLFGGGATEFNATINQMPLAIADVLSPGLGLGGTANGTIAYRDPASGTPTGRADLRIRGLTRSGLVLSSKPVDVGLTAVLTGNNMAARAVAVSGGQTIGRGQVRITPGGGGDLAARLTNGQMFAQIRFNGAADTLWRLTGVEGLDISGPVAIGADITGSAQNPSIRGSLRTTNARLESPITGMVLTGINTTGRFSGSRLVLDNFAAIAGPGTITGTGSFVFGGDQAFGMDLNLQADRARLLARDDIGATVTGPLTLRSDGKGGGTISGDVELVRSSFRLGRASAAAAVPKLNVREINGRADEAVRPLPTSPWRLAIKARAFNQLAVTGLGLDSEWRANLDIGGSVDNPRITGRADLVRGGYEFAGRRFDLERGVIRFQGEAPPDPILDIVANGDTQGLSATIRVSGTGQKPNIAFSSVPALPEDELLSRLLFGTSITNLSAPEALQLAASVNSLRGGGGGLNPINALRTAIGLDRLRILPADTTTGQGTSVSAGKYITRRLYVEVITDGQGYSATQAEFHITRWLSVLSSISTVGRSKATVRVSKDY